MVAGTIDTYSMEKRYFHKDGSIIWINLSVSMVTDGDGKPKYFISQIENITDWKNAQITLLEQQSRITNILDGTHAGTWEWNVQTGETRFNEVWAEIIGYTLEELEPVSIETWMKFTHPDDLAESNKRLQACFNREADFYECECRMKHRDGHYVWVLDRGKVMSWTDDGKPLWMFGTHLDISRSKELELRLREQKAFIDAVLETINVGIVVCNNEGQLTLFNKATRDMHGVKEENLPPEEWSRHYQLFEADHKTPLSTERVPLYLAWKGEEVISEISIRHQCGKMIDVLATGTRVLDGDGQPLGAVVAMTDVTQLRSIRQQLADNEAKFRGIFNSTFQFIGFLKVDGELLEANQTALDFAGIQLDEIKGKKFWDCYWWQKDEQTQRNLQQAIAKAAAGEMIVYEVEVQGKDQQLITILFSLKPLLDAGGNVVAIIPEGRPINEIVQARHQLEQKNEELEQFASIAAHDLKEPLRMVGNFMSLLKSKYGTQLDTTANKYVDFAINGSQRMSQLINDLLEYARVGSEQVPFETIQPEALLLDILSLNDSFISEKKATISWGTLPDITGQKTAIQLLFQNLIMNGIKYQEPDHLPVIRISGRELSDAWLFSVEDNGIGIPAQYYEKIFQVFSRLHSKDKYSGTGMGLATCKKIVAIHGGRIWVESQEGAGSCFHFTVRKSV
jgi:PAS domain S-box-containing protein